MHVLKDLPSKTRQKISIKLDKDLLKKIAKKLEKTFNKEVDIRTYIEKNL